MLQQWTAFWKARLSQPFYRSIPSGLMVGGTACMLTGIAISIANKAGASIPVDRSWLNSFTAIGAIMGFAGTYWFNVRATRSRLNWLTANANWAAHHIRLLGSHANASANVEADGRAPKADYWPWGSHHTEMLGHVEAAASKWWANYDPASPDTAPTNDMVSEWLCDERGVSKDKAKAIASILRADGLRTGPRR